MSTKYVLYPSVWNTYEPTIRTRECTRETASFVWLKEYYSSKDRDKLYKKRKDGDVFSTWAEAHAALTRRADLKLQHARRELEAAQAFAGNVRGMKPPTTKTPDTTEPPC